MALCPYCMKKVKKALKGRFCCRKKYHRKCFKEHRRLAHGEQENKPFNFRRFF